MFVNISDKDFQGQVIHVEMAARKVPPGGFFRGKGKHDRTLSLNLKKSCHS